MSFTQLLRILWARRGLVLLVTTLAVLSAVSANLFLPKSYVATASLVVDSRGVDPVTGATAQSQSAAALLATQLDVISSRTVALKVVDRLGLAAGGRDSAAHVLLRKLTVKPSQDSNVIQIRFEDSNPKFAAQAANAFADAYLETNLELKLDPAKRRSAWFDGQLQGMRATVEARRRKFSEYQQSHGIVAAEDKVDVETMRLEELSRQLLEAQRNAKDAGARLDQADRAVASGSVQELPDILGNSLLQSMKTDLTRAEGRLAELAERFDRKHPQYISAAAEVRALSDRLAAEVRNAKGSIAQSAQIAQQQVAELQRAFDSQKNRVLELRQQGNELEVQDREVENAQGAYDSALQRSSQLRMESQLNQTSVAVLDRASPPATPATPGLALSAVLSLVFGTMFGCALALLLERLDRRVRSGDELEEIIGLAVLAHVPHVRASFQVRRARGLRRVESSLVTKRVFALRGVP
jgi:succinoglycan biosynthesis transport protein ExoP